MLRVILILSFVLAVSGSALYMTKLSVDGRYDRLSQLQAEIKAAENRAIILEAEWAYPVSYTHLTLPTILLV